MTRERLEALLDLLGSDRRHAAQAYEALRARLVRFFVWKGVVAAEEGADEALDRMARRVQEGEHVQDPYRYVLGVARNVLREAHAREARQTQLRERWPVEISRAVAAGGADAPADQASLDCLSRCLRRLGPETRRLLLEYHRADKRERIERRRRLAQGLGVSSLVLRVRVHRLRQTVEACVRKCLQQGNVTSSFPGSHSIG